MVGLTASQTMRHPAYATAIRSFPPTQKGIAESVSEWGYKCDIAYEIHGTGPKKLVLVSGLGVLMFFWQRQIKEFGHVRASEFSLLVFDNRGMGDSGKPWMPYTMKMLAQDVIAVVDHVGWTNERELHIVGTSMGGMIVQEVALSIPKRIASLILVATGPRLIDTGGLLEDIMKRVRVFIPEPLDWKLARMRATFIGEDYANSPDAPEETDEDMPLFPLRGDRYVAEMAYMHHNPLYSHSGWFRQALAVVGWGMTDEDLAQIGDTVGRKRILSMHGTVDKGIHMIHNEELVKGLGGTGEDGIKLVLLDGCGHIPQVEKQKEFTELISCFTTETQQLGLG